MITLTLSLYLWKMLLRLSHIPETREMEESLGICRILPLSAREKKVTKEIDTELAVHLKDCLQKGKDMVNACRDKYLEESFVSIFEQRLEDLVSIETQLQRQLDKVTPNIK